MDNTAAVDLPSTHRMPTVSAADALDELSADRSRFVSTGLEGLDQALKGATQDIIFGPSHGGFQKGQVIEVWGPPASGKTTIGARLAADAIDNGGKVVWVDAFRSACGRRLFDLIDDDSDKSSTPSGPSRMDGLLHFTCPSIPHFLALLCRPTTSSLPQDVSLVVVDSLSALINQSFPKNNEPRNGPKWARRLQVLQSIISSLQKLAATRDIVVVILSQCATKMQAERGATLIPAINARVWDQGIATRLVLFRDWMFKDRTASGVYSIGLQKINGQPQEEGFSSTFAFEIQTNRLVSVEYDGSQASVTLSKTQLQKRKFGETDFEVADSEDEDYGWEEDDATSIPVPCQWQGSEDLLIGQHDVGGNRLDGASDGEHDVPDEEEGATRLENQSSHLEEPQLTQITPRSPHVDSSPS